MLLHRNYCYTILSLLLACLAFTACVPEDIELSIITPLESSKTYTVNGVSFTMIGVEGGTFVMGSLDDDSDADDHEKPAHLVTLSSYYIGETEVTQELWQAVMGRNPSSFRGDMQRPVECVSWGECQTFISRLNELTGENFCLPTEAEWEYAARGGKKSKGYKYSGSNNCSRVAWFYDSNSTTYQKETHAVKTKQPNELGIYDMSGNVTEWCSDWYGKYSSSAQTAPDGPSSGSYRVIRGGSYYDGESDCRITVRKRGYPDDGSLYIGLRLVISSSNTYTVNGVSFTMIEVEGGSFIMGSPDSDSDAYSDEKPAHQVTLSSYYIGETEVTQALWQAVMGSNPSYFTGDMQRPVENVSWNDCQTFIKKLNQLTGENFRLPTEAEWVYAVRGGKESKGYKYSGSNTLGNVAWYESNSSSKTHPVKTKHPNELGIYDMSGNVWEWCSDRYGSYFSSAQTDPIGPSSGSFRVLRGGSWGGGARGCRVACRYYNYPDYRENHLGLRLAISITESDDDSTQEPTITIATGEASAITFESVTLSGVVSGATNEISCGIIYGTSSDMSSLDNNRVGTSSDSAYSIEVSNLQPGTTYYYCAYAIIGGDEQYGEVRSFTTKQAITLTTGEASAITFESVTLSGVVSGATNEISCGIIYGTSSDMSSLDNNRVGTSSDGAYSIEVSNLQPGTTYYYCAYVIIDGEEKLGEVLSFTTEQEVVEPGTKTTYTVNGVSFTMIEVEGGTFTMGSPDSDSDADSNEKPTHLVTLSSYYIGETEVTQALWQAVMGSNPSEFTGDLQRPVEEVSWNDCQTFISKLNELTGENFRLPTEAEWEYAARGGNKSKGYKYSGSNTIGDVAWYWDNSSITTHAVKTKQPNELGIYDMSGNVYEWCSDWYGSYSSSSQTNPTGPSSGSIRVLRGGSWNNNARYCRVAYRLNRSPDYGYSDFGLRLVR